MIPEDAIESYFVWIPRYKYKLFDQNNGNYTELTAIENKPQIIEVIFGTDTTTDTSSSCATPNQSGADGTCSVGKYMTHPAFTSFDTESSITKGMWVGKFETGYKGAATTSEAQKNENNSSKIQIKPNVYSWRNIQIPNAYWTSYNYKRKMDSHMMKNTEWGAVAYLQHSAYGSHTSVRINNNSSYLTGYAAVHEPTTGTLSSSTSCNSVLNAYNEFGIDSNITQPWNTDVGIKASTTGNITGIYDMSGGVWEFVMGVMANQDGIPCSGRNELINSGFNGPYCSSDGFLSDGISDFPSDIKYYDVYSYSTVNEAYQRKNLGDATGEMGPFAMFNGNQSGSWYYNSSLFVNTSLIWFLRSGGYSDGNIAGLFYFSNAGSHRGAWVGFRVVLI